MIPRYCFLSVLLVATAANAGNSTLDAAIGGGLGGAAGAAIGNEVGGREGAIVGGALGAGVGAAVTTDSETRHPPPARQPEYDGHFPAGEHYDHQFCPPGQGKKGRC